MANRNDSDARQHETLPGPGPGSSAPNGGNGRPVEQMVDSAIERIAVERRARERAVNQRGGSAELARRVPTEANLATRDAAAPALRVPTRLRWKGLDVSEEFRQYAERVARGEDLPPFEGRVLAEPNPAFPWGGSALADEEPRKRGAHPFIWGAAIVVLGLLGWSVALKLEALTLEAPEPSARVQTTVAPLAPPASAEPGPKSKATPPARMDAPHPVASTQPGVAAPGVAASGVAASGVAASGVAASEVARPASAEAVVPPAPLPSEPAPRVEAYVASSRPAQSSAAVAAGASVRVDLSRPGALGQAVGAALAARSTTAPPAAAPAPAASKAALDDEFGIMAAVSPAPAAPAAPAGAKSNGSVGDLSRAGQPAGSGVRKEPGSESSAKGSLLVDTPSF